MCSEISVNETKTLLGVELGSASSGMALTCSQVILSFLLSPKTLLITLLPVSKTITDGISLAFSGFLSGLINSDGIVVGLRIDRESPRSNWATLLYLTTSPFLL